MKQKEIVIASTNQNKIIEFKRMLEPLGYTVYSLKDFKDFVEVEETGSTFLENAILKAQAITNQYRLDAIGDDSGLEIDALNKEPGIYSARYLGHDTSYDYKNQVILQRMEGVINRSCRYVCAIAYTSYQKAPVTFYETVECVVHDMMEGENGFGYDPIIYYPPLHKTMAMMLDQEKDSISHRGKAFRKLKAYLDEKK